MALHAGTTQCHRCVSYRAATHVFLVKNIPISMARPEENGTKNMNTKRWQYVRRMGYKFAVIINSDGGSVCVCVFAKKSSVIYL